MANAKGEELDVHWGQAKGEILVSDADVADTEPGEIDFVFAEDLVR